MPECVFCYVTSMFISMSDFVCRCEGLGDSERERKCRENDFTFPTVRY